MSLAGVHFVQQKHLWVVGLSALCVAATVVLWGTAAGQGVPVAGDAGPATDGFPWPYVPGRQGVVPRPPVEPIQASRPSTWPGDPVAGRQWETQSADDPPPYRPGQATVSGQPQGDRPGVPVERGVEGGALRQLPPPPQCPPEGGSPQASDAVASPYYLPRPNTASPYPQVPYAPEVARADLGRPQQPPAAGQMEFCEGAEILARVGSEVILASEVLPAVNEMIAQYEDRVPPDELEQVRRVLIQQQLRVPIETKLIYLDALSEIPEENLPRIEQQLGAEFERSELERMMESAKVETREELDLKLRALGTSVGRRKQAFIQRALAQSWWHQEKSRLQVEVGYDEMLEYYHEHLADFEKPARVRWEELTVRLANHPTREAAYATIASMGNQVLAGVPFGDVARGQSDGPTASEGGVRRWTHKGSLVCEELDQALFGLPVGQLSPILEGDDELHIVRVIEREPHSRVPFAEAQAEIRPQLIQQRTKGQLEDYIARLRQRVPVWTVFDEPSDAQQLSGREGNLRR